MDNRTVIAYGMLLGLVALAIGTRSLDQAGTKEILISLVSGTMGYMAHKVQGAIQRLAKPPATDDQSGKVRSNVG